MNLSTDHSIIIQQSHAHFWSVKISLFNYSLFWFYMAFAIMEDSRAFSLGRNNSCYLNKLVHHVEFFEIERPQGRLSLPLEPRAVKLLNKENFALNILVSVDRSHPPPPPRRLDVPNIL